MPNTRFRSRLAIVAVLLASVLSYAKTFSNDFTYDDRIFAAAYTPYGRNTMVVDDHSLADYFSTPMGQGVQESSRGFRPITVLSYAAVHHLFRTPIDPPRAHPSYPDQVIEQEWQDPAGPHHVLNVLLHVVATLLVYVAVRNFTGSGLAPLAAAAVFGLHALRSDPVCSVVGRGELLPFVLGASGMLLYARGLAHTARARWLALGGAGLCVLLAFLSKESALAWCVFVPLYALALEVHRGRTWRSALHRQLVPSVAAVVVPVLVFAVLYLRFLNIAVDETFEVSYLYNQLYHMPLLERLPTAVMVWGYGLVQVVAPFSLACDYGWRVFDTVGWGDWRFWLAALALLGVLGIGVRAFRSAPLVFLAMAAFLGFSFITSNIPTPVETIYGERLLYTPALGLSFVVAELVRRWPKPTIAVVAVWLVASTTLCIKRSFDWQDNATLYAVDAEGQPRSVAMQLNMAGVCRRAIPPDWDRRESYLQRTLAIDPKSFTAKNELATDLMDQRRFDEAASLLEVALAEVQAIDNLASPDFMMRHHGVTILVNLGVCLQRAGHAAEARRRFEEALAAGRKFRQSAKERRARLALMWLAWQDRDAARVEQLVNEASSLFGDDPVLQVQRGLLVWARGDQARAASMLNASVPNAPQSEELMFAWDALVDSLLSTGKRRLAAARMAQQAELLLQIPDVDRAAKVVARGLAFQPDSLELRKAELWVAWAKDDPALITRLLAAAQAAAPREPELSIHAGLLAHRRGHPKQAVQILGPVLPNRYQPVGVYLRAWVALTESLVQLADYENARKMIRFVCETNHNLPRSYARKLLELHKQIERRGGA